MIPPSGDANERGADASGDSLICFPASGDASERGADTSGDSLARTLARRPRGSVETLLWREKHQRLFLFPTKESLAFTQSHFDCC